MNQLRIIVSSTRPNRVGPNVTQWVHGLASTEQWEVKVLDLAQIGLPFLDEEDMPANGNYAKPHTLAWASEIFQSDAVVVVTPEYNKSIPAPLKNAIDYLYAEWQEKPVAVIGYGFGGASSAREDLAKVLAHLRADLAGSIGLNFGSDLELDGTLTADDAKADEVRELLDTLHSRLLDLDEVPVQS